MHLAGHEVQDVFETLTETGDDYDTALAKLDAYFKPEKNIPFERHTFRQATQNPSETMDALDAYVTRLKRLVQTCDYETLADEMIRDQVLEKCYSTRLRRRLLCEQTLTLDAILRIARSAKSSLSKCSDQQSTVWVKLVHGVEIPTIFDSGASVNVLDKPTFEKKHLREKF